MLPQYLQPFKASLSIVKSCCADMDLDVWLSSNDLDRAPLTVAIGTLDERVGGSVFKAQVWPVKIGRGYTFAK